MLRPLLFLAATALVAACAPDGALDGDCADCDLGSTHSSPGFDDGSDDNMEAPQSACGNVWYVDMTVTGILTDVDGRPLADAEVWLEERAWMPTSIHGEGMTDANGMFEFEVIGVPIVEECWGWAALFHVVGERDLLYGEIDANMQVVRGWQDGSHVADVSNLPFMLTE